MHKMLPWIKIQTTKILQKFKMATKMATIDTILLYFENADPHPVVCPVVSGYIGGCQASPRTHDGSRRAGTCLVAYGTVPEPGTGRH